MKSYTICNKIILEGKALGEWSATESDDYFTSKHYSGGFDAVEAAFCFSYFDKSGQKFWFQLTLDEISSVLKGSLDHINLRSAE